MADRGPGRCADPVRVAGDGAGRLSTADRSRTAPGEEPALFLDLDGYEGPIDLLLTLAREQKVDLAKLSILALADQYLASIAPHHRLRFECPPGYLALPSQPAP